MRPTKPVRGETEALEGLKGASRPRLRDHIPACNCIVQSGYRRCMHVVQAAVTQATEASMPLSPTLLQSLSNSWAAWLD